uniref:Uncharacterized protein n=1 Tax=Sphaeramia orbicularis TaxID=375764 RepID=A0A673BJT3_9TELE
MTFSSLSRQIECGLSKGYHEDEIIDAVIHEVLLEKLNTACANEKERQDKKKNAAPRVTTVNTVQSGDPPTTTEKKTVLKQSTVTLPPDSRLHKSS